MDTDVLVIGAGTTGLVAAAELHRHGARVIVVDRRAGPVPDARVAVLGARSLEALDPLGVTGALLDRGHRAGAVRLVTGRHRRTATHFARLGTPHPYALVCRRAGAEEVLRAHLADRGVTVRWGTSVAAVAEDATGVRATLTGPTTGHESLDARYVVDCGDAGDDLAASLGVTATATGEISTIAAGDVPVPAGVDGEDITVLCAARGATLLLPLGDGLMRVAGDPGVLRTMSDTAAGRHLAEPGRLTRDTVEPRILDQYRAGRILFAGDAAHRLPAGVGLGLNLGVHDAADLGWKLAYVALGLASDSLLHTYQAERRAVAVRTAHAAERLRGLAHPRPGRLAAVTGPVRHRLLGSRALRDRLAALIAQTGVHYGHTPVARSHREHGARAAGDRVGDFGVSSLAASDTRLSDLLARPGYLLFGYSASAVPHGGREALADLLDQVSAAYTGLVHPHLVLPEGVPADGPVGTLVDTGREFAERFRARDGDLFLIRPDGHLAFQLPRASAALLPNLLGAWVVTHATTPALTPTHSVLG